MRTKMSLPCWSRASGGADDDDGGVGGGCCGGGDIDSSQSSNLSSSFCFIVTRCLSELEEQALQLLKEMDSMRILRKEIEQVISGLTNPHDVALLSLTLLSARGEVESRCRGDAERQRQPRAERGRQKAGGWRRWRRWWRWWWRRRLMWWKRRL